MEKENLGEKIEEPQMIAGIIKDIVESADRRGRSMCEEIRDPASKFQYL